MFPPTCFRSEERFESLPVTATRTPSRRPRVSPGRPVDRRR